jgi:hypothetical protein
MRRLCLAIAVAGMLAVLGAPGRGRAEEAAPADQTRQEQDRACRADALRLCAFDIPFESKIAACLERNMERLSPACRAMFK